MTSRWTALAASLLLTVVAPRAASASQGGIFDIADSPAGCSCHSNPIGNPSPAVNVLLTIDGAAATDFAGFEPGSTHAVSLWVLGPSPGFVGFNLKVDAGTLVADDTAQIQALTECAKLRKATPFPGVVQNPNCPAFDPRNPACKPCSTVDTDQGGNCRACDDLQLIDIQATHVDNALPAPKGKNVPIWDFVWTAPNDPAIEQVQFWAVGNDVSGEGTSGFDFWAFMDPNPTVVHRK